MRLLMNFKHCTQDEIYPTRYLVLQVIDIAKPHCHLSSEAESLWFFLHCLTSYISSRRLVSKSYLWSYLYGQSLFSRAVSVLICTSILNGIWRPKRISVWSCCCYAAASRSKPSSTLASCTSSTSGGRTTNHFLNFHFYFCSSLAYFD